MPGGSGAVTGRRPLRCRAFAIGYTVLLSYLLMAPEPLAIFGFAGAAAQQTIDWTLAGGIQHLIAYAVFSMLWTWAVRGQRGRWTAWCLAAVHAGGTELWQSLIPQRECDGLDLLANLCGIAIGGLLAWLFVSARVPRAPGAGNPGATGSVR